MASPYAAPNADLTLTPSSTATALEEAGPRRRFLNLVIDTVAASTASFVVAFVVAIGFALADAQAVLERALDGPLANVFGLVLYFAYFASLELASGRTLGKLITGTRVVTTDGGRPTAG